MKKTDLRDFFGVPVLVQLKLPIAVPQVSEKIRMPHADDPRNPQWVPGEMNDPNSSPDVPVFVTVQMIRYAVVYDVEGTDQVEVRWVIPGIAKGATTIVGTLMSVSDVAFVTRVVFVEEGSPLIIAKG